MYGFSIYSHFTWQFSEIRDKYALTNREISELNTQIQDSEYDLQKANHRVENLVKRLNELEEMRKKIREGEMPAKEEIKVCIDVYFTNVLRHR